MTHDSQKPSGFSPPVDALVAHERVLPAQPDDVRARILSRARAATLAGPPANQAVRVTHGASKSFAAGAIALAVAGGVAAAIYLLGGSTPSAPFADAPASARTPAPSPPAPPARRSASSDLPTAAQSAPARPVEAPAPSVRSPATSRQESGLEEIQLLSRARKADVRRDYAGVLSVLSEHERTFPAGRLSEEREVLRVKALVGLGRTEQARRTAARFQRQFPRSVLRHKIDEMLASMP